MEATEIERDLDVLVNHRMMINKAMILAWKFVVTFTAEMRKK